MLTGIPIDKPSVVVRNFKLLYLVVLAVRAIWSSRDVKMSHPRQMEMKIHMLSSTDHIQRLKFMLYLFLGYCNRKDFLQELGDRFNTCPQ